MIEKLFEKLDTQKGALRGIYKSLIFRKLGVLNLNLNLNRPMKPSLFTFFTIVLFVSCQDNKEKNDYPITEPDKINSTTLEGAWELVGFYNFVDNKVVDSFNAREGYRQVKLYTSSKVMWSKQVPSDSTEWFGYGNYKLENDRLTEVLDYGSKMMSKIIEERKEFIYELDLKNKSFSQIEIDDDGNRIYSENYRRIE